MLLKTNFLAVLLFSSFLFAQSVHDFGRPVVGFVNYATANEAANEIYFISADGQVDIFRDGVLSEQKKFRISHADCLPHSPSTAGMDEDPGLTLAYPFMAGVNRICFFDEKSGSLRLISNFERVLPKGAFSAVYAGGTETEIYFLINGRSLPEATSGYIWLVSIDRRSKQLGLRELLTDVPGYSGAMLFEQNKIWVNSYPGQVFRMMLTDVQRLITSGQSASFSTYAAYSYRTDEHQLSSFVMNNKNSFLYYNGKYESFLLNRQTGLRRTVQTNCVPAGPAGEAWFVVCAGTSLQLWNP